MRLTLASIFAVLLAFTTALDARISYAARETPVEKAVKDGNLDLVKGMLQSGADSNAGDETPLYWAARSKNLDMVKLLVKHGANVNRTISYGHEPLIAAIKFRADEVGMFFVDETNIDLNKRIGYSGTETYLYHAIQNRSHKLMMALLEKGVPPLDLQNPYIREKYPTGDEWKNQYLTEATKQGDPLAIRMLLEFGANPNTLVYSDYRDNFSNYPLFADVLRKTDDIKVVEVFLRKGLDVNRAHSKTRKTLLHYAVDAFVARNDFNGNVIKKLVEAGANLHAKDKDSLTPVLYAMTLSKTKQRDGVISLLKSLGGS